MIQLAIEEENGESLQKEPKIEFPSEEPEHPEPIIQEVTEDIVPTPIITNLSNITTHPATTSTESKFKILQFLISIFSLMYFFLSFSGHPPYVPPMPAVKVPLAGAAEMPKTIFDVNTQKMTSKRPILQRQITKEDFGIDVENMQANLEDLKEILSGQISLDTTMVSSLFDADNENVPSL